MTLELNQPDVALNIINFDLNGNEIIYVTDPVDFTYVNCTYEHSISERVVQTPIALRCSYAPSVPNIVKLSSIALTTRYEPSIPARGSYEPTYEFTGTP